MHTLISSVPGLDPELIPLSEMRDSLVRENGKPGGSCKGMIPNQIILLWNV